MKYKGIELTEVTEPKIFEKPEKMIAWDGDNDIPTECYVYAIVKRKYFPVISETANWQHCAEIPEAKLATSRELARWLAEGHGEVKWSNTVSTNWNYLIDNENEFIAEDCYVRRWDDTEWHKPTKKYLGLPKNSRRRSDTLFDAE